MIERIIEWSAQHRWVVLAATLVLALWAVYLSLVSVGGVFLSYQWDTLLLEALVEVPLVAEPGEAVGER